MTSTTFTGQPGHSYGFYSVATDNLGEVQPTPAGAQATITVANAATPTPKPTPTHTVIIGEQSIVQRKFNKKGKAAGKAVLTGFTLDYGVPLSSAAASNYKLDAVSIKKVKKNKKTILQPITNFRVSYLVTSDAVEITLGANEKFPTGGQLTVLGGETTATGGTLTGNAVFSISKGGKSIRPA